MEVYEDDVCCDAKMDSCRFGRDAASCAGESRRCVGNMGGACGDDLLLFYSIQGDSIRETERLAWSRLDIPETFSDAADLDGFVECKPVRNGSELIVTSWKGGVAKLDLSRRVVNFSAYVPSAHSAEMLPNDRIAVVGNYLRIFDEKDGKTPLIELGLDDGHGVIWDPQRRILYVLSEHFLEEFELENWDTPTPALRSVRRTRLPGEGDGHDLAVASNGMLLVSTRDGAWHFDRASRRFSPHPALHPVYRVQSIAEADGNLVWVQAEENWWGRGFFVRSGGGEARRVSTPETRLYKVRKL